MITYAEGAVVRVVGGVMVQLDLGFTDEELKTLDSEALARLWQVRHHNAMQEALTAFRKETGK